MRDLLNSPASIAATIFLSLTGWVVFMGMPIMVGTLADLRGYSEVEVGYLASVELGGMFVSSLFVAMMLKKANRRHLAAAGLLASLLINLLAAMVEDYVIFLVMRSIAGFGSGLCYSIAIANLAATRRSTRNYSYMVFALVATNSVELYFLPDLVALFDIAGIFLLFAVFNLVSLALLKLIVPHFDEAEAEDTGPALERKNIRFAWLCIAAVACFYVCIAAFWTYIERLGESAGFTGDFIARTLALSTILSLFGCLFAYQASRFWGQSRPLIATLTVLTATVVLIALAPSEMTFLGGLILYQLLWNSIDIYQLGTLSAIDHSGRYVALVSGAQGLGQMVGPAGGATIIALGFGLKGAILFSAGAAGLALAIYLVVHFALMRHVNSNGTTTAEEVAA